MAVSVAVCEIFNVSVTSLQIGVYHIFYYTTLYYCPYSPPSIVKYMINPNLERGNRNASPGIVAHNSIYSSYGKMSADHRLIGPLAAD